MKQRPILFSTEMVKALISGRKTQTRRLAKDLNKCPYGVVGNQLWVKETFSQKDERIIYRADVCSKWDLPDGFKWKPSLFMPRVASRILLEIESIHIEPLCDISEEDAIAEGVEEFIKYRDYFTINKYSFENPIDSFASLWNSIKGNGAFEMNYFVWVIKFKVI